MLFNSLQYAVFLPCVVAAYFLMPVRRRWALLLVASYYFYMCWRVEYAALVAVSTLVDYLAALGLERSQRRPVRRALLGLSLTANLGLLFTFKYLDFAVEALAVLPAPFNPFRGMPAFDLLLPVGISFYTFQTLSYTIDVYRGACRAERHLGVFAVYVAFFPQLVAGPIERPQHLMPQFHETHRADLRRLADGLQLILWGLFKKLVIADRLAVYVDQVFDHPGLYAGAPVCLAAAFFSIQIYCDFSGYSDIAVGSAQLMGFRLMDNFRRPYFATNIQDFWRRWHISLSTWFRDYVYIPLGGSRVPTARVLANLLITFTVSGLWHGANWTFIVWGALHGAYFCASRLTQPLRDRCGSALARWGRAGPATQGARHALSAVYTFGLVTLAYVFFRADSLVDALVILRSMFATNFLADGVRVMLRPVDFTAGLVAIVVLLAVEARWERQDPTAGRSPFADCRPAVRGLVYYALALATFIFGRFGANPFIYFQF